MTRWEPRTVLAAAADWVWTPPDAEVITRDFTITLWPDWSTRGVEVTALRSQRPPDEILDEAADIARGWGRDELGFPVTEWYPPAVQDELLSRGATLHDTLDVLALMLDGETELPVVPDGIEVHRVRTMDDLRRLDAIEAEVFDHRPSPEQRLLVDLADLVQSDHSVIRLTAHLDGIPVAGAGVTMAGPPHPELGKVARLWGAGTRPSARGRGAYRALITERVRIGIRLGATLALVKGRITTSAPILQRVGFERYGEERLYRLRF